MLAQVTDNNNSSSSYKMGLSGFIAHTKPQNHLAYFLSSFAIIIIIIMGQPGQPGMVRWQSTTFCFPLFVCRTEGRRSGQRIISLSLKFHHHFPTIIRPLLTQGSNPGHEEETEQEQQEEE